MGLEEFLNYILDSGFLLVLVSAGLLIFSIAYLISRYIEKKELDRYTTYILIIGFLLVCISFLATRMTPGLPLKILYYITYISGMICAFLTPGFYIKGILPKRFSALLLAAPSAAIPFLFYNCCGNSCGTESLTINLYSFYPLFEYFGGVMLSVMIFGLMILLSLILKKENPAERSTLILALLVLCAASYFFSPAGGAVAVAAYLYIALKDKKIDTGIKNVIILYISAGIIALILLFLKQNYIYCVNSCTFDYLLALALSLIILGSTIIVKREETC